LLGAMQRVDLENMSGILDAPPDDLLALDLLVVRSGVRFAGFGLIVFASTYDTFQQRTRLLTHIYSVEKSSDFSDRDRERIAAHH
jgi:hypothetical protein